MIYIYVLHKLFCLFKYSFYFLIFHYRIFRIIILLLYISEIRTEINKYPLVIFKSNFHNFFKFLQLIARVSRKKPFCIRSTQITESTFTIFNCIIEDSNVSMKFQIAKSHNFLLQSPRQKC